MNLGAAKGAEMREAAAPTKVADILYSFDPALLSAAQRWEGLPEASRKILASFQAAGGGAYVPNEKWDSQ
jgi:hypothetical protein